MTQLTKRTQGFTLIELMLAMTFLGSMLLLSTLVFVQVLGIYNKGIAVKQMNQVGRILTDDLIKVSNGSSGASYQVAERVRCMQVGTNVYLWGYADDTATTPEAFKDTSGNLIPFSKLGTNYQACPDDPSVGIPTDQYRRILSDNVKVYATDFSSVGTNVLRLRLVLGTYQTNANVNPVVNGTTGAVSCPANTLGNYCAFGVYETALYLPN